eukprot:9504079-Pyramimonas_sp.AAC.2
MSLNTAPSGAMVAGIATCPPESARQLSVQASALRRRFPLQSSLVSTFRTRRSVLCRSVRGEGGIPLRSTSSVAATEPTSSDGRRRNVLNDRKRLSGHRAATVSSAAPVETRAKEY